MILILWNSIFSQSIVSFNIFFHRILNGTLKSKKECNMYLLHTKCTMKKQFNDGPKSVPKKIKKTNYLNVLLRFRSQNLVKNFYCCSWGFSKDIFPFLNPNFVGMNNQMNGLKGFCYSSGNQKEFTHYIKLLQF